MIEINSLLHMVDFDNRLVKNNHMESLLDHSKIYGDKVSPFVMPETQQIVILIIHYLKVLEEL